MKIRLLILAFLKSISSSIGDNEPEYQNCLKEEFHLKCKNNENNPEYIKDLDISLKLALWNCLDDIKYKCMHKIVNIKKGKREKIEQYYGKWPFYRFLGMQEPASVLFSIWNMLAHLQNYNFIKNNINEDFEQKKYYLLGIFINVNCWIWSSIFHTKDIDFTQKMDYYCAFSCILFNFSMCVIRTFNIYKNKAIVNLVFSTCIFIFAHHVYVLEKGDHFDFGYNMKINIIFASIYLIFWIIWSIKNLFFTNQKHPYASLALKWIIYLAFCTSLELFDFPPIFGIFDSHSLWHLSTVYFIHGWYDFLVKDSNFLFKKNKVE